MANDNQSAPDVERDSEKTARYLASHTLVLLKQATERLEYRLQQDPKNGKLWFQLGNAYRGIGDLQVASNAFRHAVEQNYKTVLGGYLIALCDQTSAGYCCSENDFIPVPFLRHFNLLTNAELNMIWQTIEEQTEKFESSRVGGNQARKTARESMMLTGSKFKSFSDLFKARIKPAIKQAFETFNTEPLKQPRYDVQMTSHTNGEFYRTHTDAGPNHARILSYVYYFHKQPKAFAGGQLQLFDTNTQLNTASTTMTTIEPVHNSLIIFPSNYYHQVCTVNMPNHDRIWGRHTINGWLVDAEKQAEIDAQHKK